MSVYLPQLAKSIQESIKGDRRPIVRRYNLFHHNQLRHGVVRPDKVLTIAASRRGCYCGGAVHETFISPYPQATLEGKL